LVQPVQFKQITYKNLNPRQKENFNFQKVSAVLADYGFVTLRLSDDWQGADFIALHIDGMTFLRVQLKSRLTFQRKYRGKNLHIAFGDDGEWYRYPHDEFLDEVIRTGRMGKTDSWQARASYSFPRIPKELRDLLGQYRITGSAAPVPG
jgi:hypothetical protein